MNNTMKTVKALFGNAKTKTNGTYVVSESILKKVKSNLPDGAKLTQNKNNKNLYMIKVGDEKVIFEVKTTPTKATPKTNKTDITHKPKGSGYIILYKAKGKKEQKITNMSTCIEVKDWIKTISKKNTEYLKIYDSENRECRKSAWI